MVSTGRSCTASFTKKNDPPQSTDNRISIAHMCGFMVVEMEGICIISVDRGKSSGASRPKHSDFGGAGQIASCEYRRSRDPRTHLYLLRRV